MSAFSLAGAHAERNAAVHQSTGARILTVYVETAKYDGIDAGFPISADMIAMINLAKSGPLERRRRRAARVIMEHEVLA